MGANSGMKISIALCTYNGERFLQEQLDSIAAQTICPFELVICDDGSSDSTKEILERFVATAVFPVKLHFNTHNLGYLKNFEKAITLCSGDIIALCDQDDRWHENKLEVMQKYFCEPNVGMAFSNAAIIDGIGKETGDDLWKKVGINASCLSLLRSTKCYQALLEKPLASGCTMAFRASLWPKIKPLPTDTYLIHDGWIALWASLFSEVKVLSPKLVDYRLHQNQTSGFLVDKASMSYQLQATHQHQKKIQYQQHLNQLRAIDAKVQRWQNEIPEERKQYLLQQIKGAQEHLNLRLSNKQELSLFQRSRQVIRELFRGGYHKHSQGIRSAIVDLFYGV